MKGQQSPLEQVDEIIAEQRERLVPGKRYSLYECGYLDGFEDARNFLAEAVDPNARDLNCVAWVESADTPEEEGERFRAVRVAFRAGFMSAMRRVFERSANR